MNIKKASLVVAIAASVAAVATPQRAEAQQQAVGQATFGNLISALNNINVQIENLEALNDLDLDVGDINVIVVEVEDLLNGNRIRALNNVLRNADIDALQNFLNDNDVDILNDALNNNNVNISEVIAVDVLSGGDIVIFQGPVAAA